MWLVPWFFRNPSSLTRYGQNGWYLRRGPTTRLAALDAGRIPNRKGTSRCVNDDPAPGQGWPREGECGLPSLASVVSRSELVIGTSLQVRTAQQRLNVTRLCGVGPPHTTTIYWVLIPYICEYTDFHTWGIPTGDVSHLRGQLLTGDARRVPMARLYEKSSS